MFRCNCRIPVNSFGGGNTHVGQTAKPKLNPHRYRLDLSLALSGRKFGAGMGSFARMMLKRAKRFAAAS